MSKSRTSDAPPSSLPAENPDAALTLVGEIVAPFGVRGQVKMRPLMDNPAALIKLAYVLLRWPATSDGVSGGGHEEKQRILTVKPHQEAFLLTLSGTPDRNAAEMMRNVQVFIRPEELPPLEEDAYYENQLIGLTVVTESGANLGKIEQVHFGVANDVYETPLALIPAIGAIVLEVDLSGKKVLVKDIRGLLKSES